VAAEAAEPSAPRPIVPASSQLPPRVSYHLGFFKMRTVQSQRDLLEYLKSFKAIVAIGGYGSSQQYANVDQAVSDLAEPLFEAEDSLEERYGKGNWVMCLVGARVGKGEVDEAAPEISVLVHRLREKYQMALMTIQADVLKDLGHVEQKDLDAVFYYPTEYKAGADAKPDSPLEERVAFGGLKGGRPVGCTRVLLEVIPCSQRPLYWVVSGGGTSVLQEVSLAWDRGAKILCIEAEAKTPSHPEIPYGPCKVFWDHLEELNPERDGECGWVSKGDRHASSFEVRPGVSGVAVLITGATGLLGREVFRVFEEKGWDVHGTGYSRATGRIHKCDLLDPDQWANLCDKIEPQLVIHCAAERRPQALQKNEAYATKINADVSQAIAKTCAKKGIWTIYVSTNYVFDGEHAPYSEDATPGGEKLSVYGASKLEGEKAFIEHHPDAAIVRVPLLYGPIESLEEATVSELLKKIQQSPDAKCDNYQQRYPTSTTDLAKVFEELASIHLARGKDEPQCCSGVFHWQAGQMLTKYTMSVALAEIFGIDHSQFKCVDKKAYPAQMQYEGMNSGRMEKLFLESSDKTADSFRSDFKTNMSKFLRPFLPTDMLAQSLAGNDKTRADATRRRTSLALDASAVGIVASSGYPAAPATDPQPCGLAHEEDHTHGSY